MTSKQKDMNLIMLGITAATCKTNVIEQCKNGFHVTHLANFMRSCGRLRQKNLPKARVLRPAPLFFLI